jgi:hypothetical protein
MDNLNYNNYLNSALNQASQIEQQTQESLTNLQNFASAKTEQKELGGELLFTTLPGVFPEVGRAVQAGAKIFKGIKDLQARGSSIVEGLKTLPDDLKKLAGTKIDQVNQLVTEGSAKSLAQAKQIVEDLKSQGEVLKSQASDLVESAKAKASNIIETANNQRSKLLDDFVSNNDIFDNGYDEKFNAIKNASPEQLTQILEKSAPKEILESIKPSTNISDSVLSSIQERLPSTTISSIPQKVKVSMNPIVNESDVEKYTQAKTQADTLSSRLMNETNPQVRAELQSTLNDAKTTLNTRSRMLSLGVTEEPSLLSRGVGGLMEAGGVAGGVLSTIDEARGQMRGAGQRIQGGLMQEQAGGIISQRTAQGIQSVKGALGETQAEVAKSGTELSEQTAGLAKTAQASLETAKSGLTQAGESFAEKGSDILGSIAEKGVLETLGEVTGVAAIPVVGEIAGVAGLAWGAIEGIKDLFSHTSAPKPMVVQQAGIVRQAGI